MSDHGTDICARAAWNRDGRFVDHLVNRDWRFSLGIDTKTGGLYLATPISGRMAAVEFEAWFSITAEEHERFRADPSAAGPLLELCRMGRADDRRILEIVT